MIVEAIELRRFVKAKPILFSASMVHALLAGNKSMTRRIINPQPRLVPAKGRRGTWVWPDEDVPREGETLKQFYKRVPRSSSWGDGLKNPPGMEKFCPFGPVGTKLWVRETFGLSIRDPEREMYEETGENCDVVYRADDDGGDWEQNTYDHATDTLKREKIKAPWRPGIFMRRWMSRITLEVTAIRVERLQDITGDDVVAEGFEPSNVPGIGSDEALIRAFATGWDKLNKERGSWQDSPWLWVVSFRRIKPKEDLA